MMLLPSFKKILHLMSMVLMSLILSPDRWIDILVTPGSITIKSTIIS